MLFFGSLCLYVMGYGAYSLFSGATIGLSRGLVKKTIEAATEVFEEVKRDDFGLRPEEGLFATKHVWLSENCPILVKYQGGALASMAHARLELTNEEVNSLTSLVDALNAFVNYADSEPALSDEFIVVQINLLVRPIVNFVSNLPPTRIHTNEEET